MPSGKELQQLPIGPGMSKDRKRLNRTNLSKRAGGTSEVQPSKVTKEE